MFLILMIKLSNKIKEESCYNINWNMLPILTDPDLWTSDDLPLSKYQPHYI